MSLRSRLYLVSALTVAVLFAPAYYALGQLGELRDIAFDLRTRHAAAFLTVGRLQTSVAEMNRLQRSYVAAPGPELREELHEQMRQASARLEELERSDYGPEVPKLSARVDSLVTAAERIDQLILAGQVDQATVLFQDVKTLFSRTHESLHDLAVAIDTYSTAEAVRARQISATAARTTAVGVFVALVVALLMGLVSIGALTSPLRRLRSAMASVAGGEFAPPEDLPYRRSDEVGDLSRSFRSMARRLAELDRLKAEFVTIASHELKTPVSVIRGYAEMVEEGFYGPVTDEQREILRYIQEQTAALAERVNQLLSLSRFEATGMTLELAEADLRSMLQDLHHTFQPLASQKQIRLLVEADGSAPSKLVCDEARVRGELLGNLISNALKFTPPGGEVRVQAWGEPGRAVFQVVDTGEGIPAAQLPYIFQKYYQAGQHAGKVGTGLGLAIAREVVDAHGGTIRAESEPGRGSGFRVELPLEPASPVARNGRKDWAEEAAPEPPRPRPQTAPVSAESA